MNTYWLYPIELPPDVFQGIGIRLYNPHGWIPLFYSVQPGKSPTIFFSQGPVRLEEYPLFHTHLAPRYIITKLDTEHLIHTTPLPGKSLTPYTHRHEDTQTWYLSSSIHHLQSSTNSGPVPDGDRQETKPEPLQSNSLPSQEPEFSSPASSLSVYKINCRPPLGLVPGSGILLVQTLSPQTGWIPPTEPGSSSDTDHSGRGRQQKGRHTDKGPTRPCTRPLSAEGEVVPTRSAASHGGCQEGAPRDKGSHKGQPPLTDLTWSCSAAAQLQLHSPGAF